jgi:hypothetical protein
MKTGSSATRVVLIVVATFVVFWAALAAFIVYWRHMAFEEILAPYQALVERHATEKEVVNQLGKPNEVVRSRVEFDRAKYGFRLVPNMSLGAGETILVYFRDRGLECNMVYILIARDGTAKKVALGIT